MVRHYTHDIHICLHSNKTHAMTASLTQRAMGADEELLFLK